MNIVLITPTPPDLNAFGVRTISSILKEIGFSTKIIFLPGELSQLRSDGSYIYQYSRGTLDQIAQLCQNASLIGFSFMSQYFDRAVQINEYLKSQFDIPIIWGGTHPTFRPEQCLEYCDIVCIGEGDLAIVELVEKISKGKDYTDTKNCWFKIDGQIKRNEEGPVVQDLDKIPYLDYNLKNHYVFDCISGDIIHIDNVVMKDQFLRTPFFNGQSLITHRIMTSRGCPHRCSYCASSAMMRLRRRSVDNVIDELEIILLQFNYIELISFFDDTFFAAPVSYFEEFRDKYKHRIGLPFHAQCSPTTISKERMDLLVDAGLYHTEMGIQSGSDRIMRMYRRPESNQKIIEAATLITRYQSKMLPPYYHVILDNPWETKNDVVDTIKLILRLPGKFKLSISSLILYPGTELNERARKEGILKDELNEVCRKPFTFPETTYLNYLIYLSGFPMVSRVFLKVLLSAIFVNSLQKDSLKPFYGILFSLTNKVRILGKGVMAVIRGDFQRITNYFKLYRLSSKKSLHGR